MTAGTYALNIEYHQGSVCPISGFDATIAAFDTILVVMGPNGISTENPGSAFTLNAYPNPTSGNFIIDVQPYDLHEPVHLRVSNIFGQEIIKAKIDAMPFRIETLQVPGLYVLTVADQHGDLRALEKVVIE